ncbi:acyltransferase family protein [Streptomyces lanatus]|uniref:Acyltransferase n=1 Tax=Streptomyces lanatus TaxID=66900 RepID=A0ABV1XRQ3_9ACTN|nr:acyltransferase [Streptomyces lanatus]GHH04668.1 hypothetical protein GCM10018780_35360 [Streptomyces lanatus]
MAGISSSGPDSHRYGWLDALRGIAALVVVLDHSSYSYLPEFRRELMPHFNTSRYGIMVFFLVSGYIIPASLERRRCVRTFWTGRLLRIYPLYAAVITLALAFDLTRIAEIGPDLDGQSPASVAVAHITLLQELLGTPNLLLVLWTLSYEMAFYLLVVCLFTVRLHRHSAAVSATLAVLAAASAMAGIALPTSALSGAVGTGPLIVWASLTMAVAIGCASAEAYALRVFGGVLGAVPALVLVALNATVPLWESLVILAVMFLGTAVHRAERGQITWARAGCTTAVVLVCAVASANWYGDGRQFTAGGWTLAFAAAVLTFATGLALRHHRTPRPLTALGIISYSVYLVHPLLLAVSDGTLGRSRQDDPVREVLFVAVLLPLSALTYRFVEVPGRNPRRSRDGLDALHVLLAPLAERRHRRIE